MKYPKRSQYKYAKTRYGSGIGLITRLGFVGEEASLSGFQKMRSTPGGNRPAENQAGSEPMQI